MVRPFLSARFWPWRLAVAMGLPWLFGAVVDRMVRLPGGPVERAIEFRILMAIVDVLVLVAVVRWMEGRSLKDSGLFGRVRLGRRLTEGFALGAGPVAVHAAALAAIGMYAFSLPGSASAGEAVLLAGALLLVGFEEEVRYRALAFRTLDQGVGSGLAMGLSGAFFGISHASNTGATPLGIAAIAFGGVFLAACYLRYGTLWVPIAFHFAWNTTMGLVLGLPISGTQLPALLHAQVNGPEAWTGGRFGPEGSTFVQGFIVAVAAFYLWRVVVERKLTPAPGRARSEATPVSSAVVPAGPPPSGPSTHGL